MPPSTRWIPPLPCLALLHGLLSGCSAPPKRVDAAAPALATDDSVALDVALSNRHACIVLGSRKVACWGDSSGGQLGLQGVRACPLGCAGLQWVVEVPEASAIAVGLGRSCAIASSGKVFCWGRAEGGAVSFSPEVLPCAAQVRSLPLPAPATQVALGAEYGCGLMRNGGVSCWGENTFGQLGTATGKMAPEPQEVPTLRAKQLAAGGSHVCALGLDGYVFCWGRGEMGQVGTEATRTCDYRGLPYPCSQSPLQVPGLAGVRRIVAGESHSCALTSSGGVSCWGSDAEGQLGPAEAHTCKVPLGKSGSGVERPCSLAPLPVPGLEQVIDLAAGGQHTCALLADRTVRCWGDGRKIPAAVPGLSSVVRLAVGGNTRASDCAIREDGSLWCWGALLGGEGSLSLTSSLQPMSLNAREAGPSNGVSRCSASALLAPAEAPEFGPSCLVHRSCASSSAPLRKCPRRLSSVPLSRLLHDAGKMLGKRISARGELAQGEVQACSAASCHDTCCNHCSAPLLLRSPDTHAEQGSVYVDGQSCTGDESRLCCKYPLQHQTVVVTGRLSRTAPELIPAGYTMEHPVLCSP